MKCPIFNNPEALELSISEALKYKKEQLKRLREIAKGHEKKIGSCDFLFKISKAFSEDALEEEQERYFGFNVDKLIKNWEKRRELPETIEAISFLIANDEQKSKKLMDVIEYEEIKAILKSNQEDLHLGTLKMLEALIGQNLDHEDLKNDLYNMKEGKHYKNHY